VVTSLLKYEYGSAFLNVPVRVAPVVRVGQFFIIFLALMSQNDVSSSIWTMFQLRYRPGVDWETTIGEDCPRTFTMWLLRVVLPNCLKLLQGGLILFDSWLVIVQSDDLVDLLKDFTALFVISSVDDVFFIMASHGFLGGELSRAADATSSIYHKDW